MSTPGPPEQPPGAIPYGYAPPPPPPSGPPPGPGLGPPLGGGYRAPIGPPRRSRGTSIAWLAAALVLVVVAIGGGVLLATQLSEDDDGDGRAGDGGSGTTVELTEAQRTEALLTTDAIGPGYTQEPDVAGDGEDVDESDFDIPDDECDAAMEELGDPGADIFGDGTGSGGASRFFTSDVGGQIGHNIAPGQDLVEVLDQVIDACDGITIVDPAAEGTLELSAGEPLAVGDESIVLDITISFDTGPFGDVEFFMTSVAWSRDGNDSYVTYSPGGDPETFEGVPIDRAEFERLVARADEQLAEVIDGA